MGTLVTTLQSSFTSKLMQVEGGLAGFVAGLGSAVKLWLAADTNVVSSGGTVSQITDRSATAAVLTGSAALISNVFGTSPALQCTGGQHLVSSALVSALQFEHTQPFSVMLAMKRTSAPVDSFGIAIGNYVESGNFTGWWLGMTASPYMQLVNSFTGPYCSAGSAATLSVGAAHTIVATYDGSGVPAGFKFYVDGALTSAGATGDYLAGDSIVNAGQIVSFGGNSGGTCPDEIAEIIVANIEFSSGQAADADAYLNAKYGIH